MRSSDEIVVRISESGSVKIEVNGAVGNKCKQMTEALEKKLGTVISDTPKREYWMEEERNENRDRQRR